MPLNDKHRQKSCAICGHRFTRYEEDEISFEIIRRDRRIDTPSMSNVLVTWCLSCYFRKVENNLTTLLTVHGRTTNSILARLHQMEETQAVPLSL
jgi:transcriptional regulator NrdR family protein